MRPACQQSWQTRAFETFCGRRWFQISGGGSSDDLELAYAEKPLDRKVSVVARNFLKKLLRIRHEGTSIIKLVHVATFGYYRMNNLLKTSTRYTSTTKCTLLGYCKNCPYLRIKRRWKSRGIIWKSVISEDEGHRGCLCRGRHLFSLFLVALPPCKGRIFLFSICVTLFFFQANALRT